MKFGPVKTSFVLIALFIMVSFLPGVSQLNFGAYNTNFFLLKIGLLFAALIVVTQTYYKKGIQTVPPASTAFIETVTIDKKHHTILFYLLNISAFSLIISIVGTLVNPVFYISALVTALVFGAFALSTRGVMR